MSNQCPFQSRFPEVNEARCIIPIDLDKGESWLCTYYFNEERCPLIKKIKSFIALKW